MNFFFLKKKFYGELFVGFFFSFASVCVCVCVNISMCVMHVYMCVDVGSGDSKLTSMSFSVSLYYAEAESLTDPGICPLASLSSQHASGMSCLCFTRAPCHLALHIGSRHQSFIPCHGGTLSSELWL